MTQRITALTTAVFLCGGAIASLPLPRVEAAAVNPNFVRRCETALTERIGQRIQLQSNTLSSYMISNAEQGIRGQGNLNSNGNFRPFQFDCQINVRDGRVVSLEYNYQPTDNNFVSETLKWSCQNALADRLGQRVQINPNSLRPYPISNLIQGLRGEAQTGRDSRPLQFDCQVNQRNGRVTRLDYNSAPIADLTPVFTSHQDGDRITTPGFTLTGQTQPNARVRVQVRASAAVLGGLVNVGGTTLVDREVIADRNGKFSVDVRRPVVISSSTRYVVRASASLNGQTRDTEITLRQQ